MGFGKIEMDMSRHRSGTVICALWLFACNAFGAQAYYSPISINSAQVPSTQTNFPVLVSQTDNRFKTIGNGGHVANANGYDIRPYSDTALTTALDYELERYNGTTGEVVMWVKVASLSSSTTPIYLGYGDSGLTTDGSNGANTFSNNFEEVYHQPNGTTLSAVESVHNASPYNLSTLLATPTPGQIDGGSKVDATHYNADGGYTWPSNAISVSAWVNQSSLANAYNTIAARMFGTYSQYVILAVKGSGKMRYVLQATTQRDCDGAGSVTLSTGTWYHVSVTYDSSAGLKGYVNGGAADCSVAANGNYNHSSSQTGFIGNDGASFTNPGGVIDEVRFSSVARSQDWNTTEYNSGFPATFETLGTEVAFSGSQRGWFIFFPQR